MAIGNETEISDRIPDKMRFHRESKFDRNSRVTQGKKKERFQCPKCEKHFGHQQILHLHLRVHDDVPMKSSQKHENAIHKEEEEENQELSNESNCAQNQNEHLQSSPANKKLIGLTKIRLEDCMRCDACSCIYLDASDYNKHMKNFHRQNSSKKHRQKKGCRSCCKHCNCKGNHQHHSLQKERGNNNLFHYNIKDRWSKMVSRRLSPEELKREIKADPDYDANVKTEIVDYSHLLSQVEVKIKTEPADDPEYDKNIAFSD